jgi:hypothetical protein
MKPFDLNLTVCPLTLLPIRTSKEREIYSSECNITCTSIGLPETHASTPISDSTNGYWPDRGTPPHDAKICVNVIRLCFCVLKMGIRQDISILKLILHFSSQLIPKHM